MMSREVHRVPVGFDWPLSKVWQGYLMPDQLRETPCPDCALGYTWGRAWLNTLAYRLGMLAGDIGDQRRGRPLHPWLGQDQYPPNDRNYQVVRPSEDIAELVAGLTGETPESLIGPMGGGSRAEWAVANRIIEAAGLNPEVWGVCPTCAGEGSIEAYEGQRADAEVWERTGPPVGDGWQLWETVSKGAPISPVFETPEALARWMASPAYTWGVTGQPSYEQALNFVKAGWAPTLASTPETGLMTGVEAVGRRAPKEQQ